MACAKMENFFLGHWYSASLTRFSCLLLPFSWVFILVSKLRYCFYHFIPGMQKKVSVPVIVVGNITVGGTGKTPLVMMLVEKFQEMGFKPGVVCRGYGAKLKSPCHVNDSMNTDLAGDEAVEVASVTGCPVVAFPDRVSACQRLIELGCTIIISDDGLQHYRLHRDIEIALIDGQRLLGNGYCLPAGPLREPKSRLYSVDRIVITQGDNNHEEVLKKLNLDCSFFQMSIAPEKIVSVSNQNVAMSFNDAREKNWAVVTGIGNPHRFIKTLDGLKIKQVEQRFFSDHHKFSQEEIDFGPNAWVIMTHKDAVKCQTFVKDRHWCLMVKPRLDTEFFSNLAQHKIFGLGTVQKNIHR